MDEEVIDRFNREFSAGLIKSLAKYSLDLANTHYWWGVQGGDELPCGETADSVVSLAIEKLLAEEIVWPADVSLKTVLKMKIKNIIGHLSKSPDNHLLLFSKITATDEDEDPEHQFEPAAPDPGPDEAAIISEGVAVLKDQLYYSFDGDAELLEIFDLYLVDEKQPREIAKELGWTKKKAYAATRRLRRRLEAFKKEWRHPVHRRKRSR